MSLKKYLILMFLATIICWLSWLTVVLYINCNVSDNVGFICFFASLFFSLLGTISLINLVLRLLIKRHDLPYKHIGISLRQSLWFAILIVVSLALLGQDLFVWWSVGLLLIGLIILEGFFLSQSYQKQEINKNKVKKF
ncbi:MAG: hypothetical protein V1898_04030 [Patescibacteria group bacterium]